MPKARKSGGEIVPHGVDKARGANVSKLAMTQRSGVEEGDYRHGETLSRMQDGVVCNGDDDWDILDDDPRVKIPQDPRGALLAEKFLNDRIMRLETKHFIYEGQVNKDGKPHGQGIKW